MNRLPIKNDEVYQPLQADALWKVRRAQDYYDDIDDFRADGDSWLATNGDDRLLKVTLRQSGEQGKIGLQRLDRREYIAHAVGTGLGLSSLREFQGITTATAQLETMLLDTFGTGDLSSAAKDLAVSARSLRTDLGTQADLLNGLVADDPATLAVRLRRPGDDMFTDPYMADLHGFVVSDNRTVTVLSGRDSSRLGLPPVGFQPTDLYTRAKDERLSRQL